MGVDVMRLTAIATGIFVALALGGCDGGADEGEDADANEQILSELPAFPLAEPIETTVSPYYREGEEDPSGHTTRVDYEVPSGTRSETIIRFYFSRLRADWRCQAEGLPELDVPQDEFSLSCERGSAILSINTGNIVATPPRFELVVDHSDRTG